MCITAQCSDPIQPGVWWRDDSQWRQYDIRTSRIILDAFVSGDASVDIGVFSSLAYPYGARYRADLRAMKQVNVSSLYQREIKIVQPGGTQHAVGGSSNLRLSDQNDESSGSGKSGVVVHYRDSNNELRQYRPAMARFILGLCGERTTSREQPAEAAAAHSDHPCTTIDLRHMLQYDHILGTKRDVVIEIPGDLQSFLPTVNKRTLQSSQMHEVLWCGSDGYNAQKNGSNGFVPKHRPNGYKDRCMDEGDDALKKGSNGCKDRHIEKRDYTLRSRSKEKGGYALRSRLNGSMDEHILKCDGPLKNGSNGRVKGKGCNSTIGRHNIKHKAIVERHTRLGIKRS